MSLFRPNPRKKLEKQLRKKLEEAAQAQRSGRIPVFAVLSAEAEEIQQELERLEADSTN